MFWGQGRSLSQNCSVLFTIYFLLLLVVLKAPDYGQVHEATDLEHDVPS